MPPQGSADSRRGRHELKATDDGRVFGLDDGNNYTMRGASAELAAKLQRRARGTEGKVQFGDSTENALKYKKASPRARKDSKNGASVLSDKEVVSIRAFFMANNTYNTQNLGISQVRQLMAIAGSPQTNAEMYKIMLTADKDGDGCLSEEEFIGLFQKARSGQLGDNQGLQRALHKICSSVPAQTGRVSTPVGGASGNRVRVAKALIDAQTTARADQIAKEEARSAIKERKQAETTRKEEFRKKINAFQR